MILKNQWEEREMKKLAVITFLGMLLVLFSISFSIQPGWAGETDVLIKKLVEKGILNQRKEGLNSYFMVSTDKVSKACQLMREVLIEKLEKSTEILKKI